MIVSDKKATLDKANELSSKIIYLITEETKNFVCEDDPAEQIYLGCHVVGNLLAKISVSLENYGTIYGITGLTCDSISDWINLISREHIKLNKEIKYGINRSSVLS